jgi:uncharacterized protein
MNEIPISQIHIQDPFWSPRLQVNSKMAIFHQWQRLEESHCIDNFRLVAGQREGFREGWFFSDSDAYKWLDAASRIFVHWADKELERLISELVVLIECTQCEDGYLFTFNQIHFPNERWGNLMIEHELYCHGHLIESCVSHYEATGCATALNIARKAADLLVSEFLVASPDRTSGHEEIEIALLRLYQTTRNKNYLELAKQFLERRGKVKPFAKLILPQNLEVARRAKVVHNKRNDYLREHPDYGTFKLPDNNFAKKPRGARLHWVMNALSGKYFQQHAPIRDQTVPEGHAVRFTYLETATALLHRLNADETLVPSLVKSWDRMVARRMYVTGGLGARPEIEGFGRDFELDPELAYTETCASLGSMFWNWEMALITGDARYSDLFEWQLYNAAAVGMGLQGDRYLYNNPLLCKGGVTRKPWFLVPCCPSNLSRTWASLGKYIYSFDDNNLWVHQYIGNQTTIDGKWTIRQESGLPWDGRIHLTFDLPSPTEFSVHFRIPSWAGISKIYLNNEELGWFSGIATQYSTEICTTASGYDPRQAGFIPVRRKWLPGDSIDLNFEMPVLLRRASPRVRGAKGMVALTCGPLVYCLESVDNPELDIFTCKIRSDTIQAVFAPALLQGIWIMTGLTVDGRIFTAIPYSLWANRGESQMTVWLNE